MLLGLEKKLVNGEGDLLERNNRTKQQGPAPFSLKLTKAFFCVLQSQKKTDYTVPQIQRVFTSSLALTFCPNSLNSLQLPKYKSVLVFEVVSTWD